jgi:hypothetical protein
MPVRGASLSAQPPVEKNQEAKIQRINTQRIKKKYKINFKL